VKNVSFYLSSQGSSEMLSRQVDLQIQKGVDMENFVINVVPEQRYQKIVGFGGAFTEASAYCYSKLSKENKEKVIKAYFDQKGMQYNLGRTHIQSSDFTEKEYAYVEDGDEELSTFTIAKDKEYILPFVKDALQETGENLRLFASPWSPPGWMKDNGMRTNGGRLLKKYYSHWAEMMVRYFKEYQKEEVMFFGLTVQNEAKAPQTWESCEYSAEEEGEFLANYLRPALDKAGFEDLKVMVWDHNKERAYDRPRDIFKVPGAKEATWGIGVHFYSGDHFGALEMAHRAFPDKPILVTEFAYGKEERLSLPIPHSGWEEVELTAFDLICGFNNYLAGVVDWNLLLDQNGGPFHDRDSGCKAGIIVDTKAGTFRLEPLYYVMRHFSQFICKDAIRIGCSSYTKNLVSTAFENPNGEIVLLVLNQSSAIQKADIRLENECIKVELPEKSLATIVISKE